jgi:hypothetical protein
VAAVGWIKMLAVCGVAAVGWIKVLAVCGVAAVSWIKMLVVHVRNQMNQWHTDDGP